MIFHNINSKGCRRFPMEDRNTKKEEVYNLSGFIKIMKKYNSDDFYF